MVDRGISVAHLLALHPQLRVELIAEPRDLNLTRRQADIALRLTRPIDDAGSRVLSKRIGTLAYAAYVGNDVDAGTEKLPWLTYEEGMTHLPQARWIAKAVEKDGIPSPLAVNDAEAMLQGVEAGLGRGLLPCIVADQISSLRRIHLDEPAFPEREIWLLTHPDLRHLARIAAVLAWIEASIRRLELASLSAKQPLFANPAFVRLLGLSKCGKVD